MSEREVRRAPASLRLGDLLVAEGLVTRAQVDEALRLQKSSERYTPLGRLLIDQKLITRDQLVSLLDRHRRGVRLGNLLVKSGEISHAQLAAALGPLIRAACDRAAREDDR